MFKPIQHSEMVNIEIPKHYTTSPSSYNGTPHLTINHDATIDLDSTNSFEGRLNDGTQIVNADRD